MNNPQHGQGLLPCPFCGSDRVESSEGIYGVCDVHCNGCGASGPHIRPVAAAILAWNTRQHAASADVERRAIARCIEIVREVRDGFLSPEYATDQPISSFRERFACDQAARAIENEFALGTIEQCKLLGKPTPFEQFTALSGVSPR